MMLTGSIIIILGISSVTSLPFYTVLTGLASFVIISVLPVMLFVNSKHIRSMVESQIDIRRHQMETQQTANIISTTMIEAPTPSSCRNRKCTPDNKCISCKKTAEIGTRV
jgi:hypothetical protein